VETTLLTEFRKWASPPLRARTRAAILRAMDAEMEPLNGRVKTIEERR
jgi:hypothetical protein